MAKEKRTRKKMKKSVKIFLSIIVLAVVAVGGYFAYQIFVKGEDPAKVFVPKEVVPEKKLQIVDVNSKSRPYAVMINNLNAARPYQSGLQDAFIMYEIIVEGGITRMLAVFKDQNTERIGSIRSARHYFLDYALENDAIYTHWGWSPQAKEDISKLKVNTVSADNYSSAFYKDNTLTSISSEHRGFTSIEALEKGTAAKKYRTETNKELLLNYSVDAVSLSEMDNAKAANNVTVAYSNTYKSSYVYDAENQYYLRSVNGTAHIDYVTKQQYHFKNLIIYNVKNETMIGGGKGRQDISNIGSGEGWYVTNGYAIPITWEKKDRSSQTIYKYEDGKEIDVNDGNTFIQIYPTGQSLNIN